MNSLCRQFWLYIWNPSRPRNYKLNEDAKYFPCRTTPVLKSAGSKQESPKRSRAREEHCIPGAVQRLCSSCQFCSSYHFVVLTHLPSLLLVNYPCHLRLADHRLAGGLLPFSLPNNSSQDVPGASFYSISQKVPLWPHQILSLYPLFLL